MTKEKNKMVKVQLETPRWETPGECWERTGEPYPDNAPVWETSKYSIKEKPSKYNRIRWYLQRHEDAIGGIENILLCTYNHLEPPPDDWRHESNAT
jgi:hypothetical protein